MNKTFLSKRGWIIYVPLGLFPFIFSFVFLMIARESPDELLYAFWIFVPLYIFLLSLLKTSYTISGEELIMRTSFIRKRIQITGIKQITRGNHIWFAGWKFALTTKGLLLRSTTHLDILVSPEEEQDFIDALLSINPAILIEEKR
ncbi:MAG: PH domain-containing protein [Bacteroidota bacterium]